MTDQGLEQFFSQTFGDVESAFTVKTPAGKSLGYGFVTFSSQSVADEIVRAGKISYQGKFMIAKRFEQKPKLEVRNQTLQQETKLTNLPTKEEIFNKSPL